MTLRLRQWGGQDRGRVRDGRKELSMPEKTTAEPPSEKNQSGVSGERRNQVDLRGEEQEPHRMGPKGVLRRERRSKKDLLRGI